MADSDDRAPQAPARPRRSFRSRLTVQAWFHLVILAMAALILTSAGVGAVLLDRTTQETDRLIGRIEPARVEALRLKTAVIDQETGLRGYLITRDADFLRPYRQGAGAERGAVRRIEPLIGGSSRLEGDLDRVRTAVADWRRKYADPLVATVADGKKPDVRRVEEGRRAFDDLRALFTVQNRHLEQASADARERLAEARTVRDLMLSGLVLVFLLCGVALALLLRSAVVNPLAALRTASRRVSAGEFEHRIPAHGPRDLHEVAEAVEEMRCRIVAELATSRTQQDLLSRQTAELDTQTAELRRSNAELEQFAYVASHDLQEPLRKVASFCQLIDKRYGDQLDERGGQYIAFAVDGAKRMQVLINDLLTFSRVGRLDDAREGVALDGSLDKALSNIGAAMEDSGARLERPASMPEITGDPTLLTMLWQNLVGNAVKFRHPDRVPEVRISCEPGADDNSWEFTVSDNGIGIPPEFADKVFVIFQRLHGRDAYGGTGIGLALCKKIVEHHGGRIWLDTDVDQGTRIRFTLVSPQDPDTEPTGVDGPADEPAPEGISA
ncbi:sensor histidine kinase [Streptomyces meridianus]|uniref:histidine kinase n=1 Tax=Streptomyces meridianus TaxID=2938945 RepID=A0ABT0XCK0_9ACTN|nr:ATP-binding protein [Streptomyces meridianus]MCM2580115.1 ATP-binding protein [Streptomyces meridianus]